MELQFLLPEVAVDKSLVLWKISGVLEKWHLITQARFSTRLSIYYHDVVALVNLSVRISPVSDHHLADIWEYIGILPMDMGSPRDRLPCLYGNFVILIRLPIRLLKSIPR